MITVNWDYNNSQLGLYKDNDHSGQSETSFLFFSRDLYFLCIKC